MTTSRNLSILGSNTSSAGVLSVNAGGTGINSRVVLNDISAQFTGINTHFALRLEQDAVTNIVDSKDLEVVVDGLRILPYVTRYNWPWLVEYDSFNGYRVRTFNSANYITIYNAPIAGATACLTLLQTSNTTQKRRYPFSATTVAFGD